jgi:hypothetical protein
LLFFAVYFLVPCAAFAWFASPTIPYVELAMVAHSNGVDTTSDSIPNAHEDALWLMGSLSGSLYFNRIDPAYIEDFGFWGYSLKFGGVWHNRVLQFDYHSETEERFLGLQNIDMIMLYNMESPIGMRQSSII